MAEIWPGLSRAARVLPRLLGEIAAAGVLLVALVFTWSDGPPVHNTVDMAMALPAFTAFTSRVASYADPVHNRTPVQPPEPPVPTSAPVMILIPALDVHRPVEPFGLDRSGAMQVPQNLWNAGWYKGGPIPGAPGNAVIEGHAGYPDAPLLFGKLHQLHAGDKIVVVLADRSRRLFLVDSLAVWRAGTGPPGMGEPYGVPRLTLITCTGPFDDHYKTYADRLAVEASYAGLA